MHVTVDVEGPVQWLMADEWGGRAWLDGVEVSDICRGVLMHYERPIAVEVLSLNERSEPFEDPLRPGYLAKEIRRGEIRVELRRRADFN
jgi:hypothetical protein